MSVGLVIDPRGMARVRRELNRLSHVDTNDLLDNIGALVTSQVQKRITSGDHEGPDGKPWPDLQVPYEKWKVKRKGTRVSMLQFDGGLVDTMQHLVSDDEVEIGSPLKKAATLQFGDDRTAWGRVRAHYPARPFLGLSDKNEDDIERTVNDWLRKELGVLV